MFFTEDDGERERKEIEQFKLKEAGKVGEKLTRIMNQLVNSIKAYPQVVYRHEVHLIQNAIGSVRFYLVCLSFCLF